MTKWYEVEVQTLVVYAVEVEDYENEIQAEHLATMDAMEGKVTATAVPVPKRYINMIKKHADRVRQIDFSEEEQ